MSISIFTFYIYFQSTLFSFEFLIKHKFINTKHMENYSEWFNNKMYEGHVRRLTQIKEKQKKELKTTKNFRIKSEPSRSQINIKKQFLPLPLVSKNQRLLLSSVVKERTINLREKQSLLENYLLSKRILQTNSVFDSKLLKKQYNFHRKVSENMNRGLKNNRKTFSLLRKKNYSQLQKLKEQNYVGTGKVSFKIKLNEIMLIKRKLQDNNESRFNLIYKPQKFKSYSIKALSFSQLVTKWSCFRATKKQIERTSGLKFEIQEVRGNEVHRMGQFRLHLQPQSSLKENSSINLSQKHNPQQHQTFQQCRKQQRKYEESSKNIIEKLLHPITKFLIGTVEFTVRIKSNFLQQLDD